MTPGRALLAALVLLLGGGDAAAHATLLSASPADGASLAALPSEVVLRFDEPVAALSMRMVDSGGAVATLQAKSDGPTLRIALPSARRQGAYLFSYRVTSADSHPVAGSIAFTVGKAQAPARPAAQEEAGSAWSVVRALRDIALLVCAGAALFSVCVGAFPAQRLVLCAGAAAAAGMTLLAAGVQGAALMDRPFSLCALASPAAWQTSAGVSARWALLGAMAVVAGGLVRRRGARAVLLGAGALAVPASLALTGHAASAQPGWLAMSAVAAHALAAAFWFGSLVALWLLLARSDPATVQALRRFSALAVPVVVVLVAGGTVFAAMQIDSLGDLVATRYGKLVIAKGVLLALLVAIAAVNRLVLVPRLAIDRLRQTLALEMLLIVAVVALTAVLSRTPPREREGITAAMAGSPAHPASLTVTPARPGRNTFVVRLYDGQGRPLDPAEASLRLSHSGAGVEAIERPLARVGPGVYRHEGSELAFGGEWRIVVRARIGDFELVQVNAAIRIDP